jgi:hypothetical protein
MPHLFSPAFKEYAKGRLYQDVIEELLAMVQHSPIPSAPAEPDPSLLALQEAHDAHLAEIADLRAQVQALQDKLKKKFKVIMED